MNVINDILKKDDINQLQSLFASDVINENSIFTFRSLKIPSILKKSPSILGVAAFYGSENCFRYIIEMGASLEYKDDFQRKIEHFACAGGSSTIIQILVERSISFSSVDQNGNNCAYYALVFHHLDTFYWIWINYGTNFASSDINGNTLIHIAVMNEDKEAITFLIQNGCDPNAKNGFISSKQKVIEKI